MNSTNTSQKVVTGLGSSLGGAVPLLGAACLPTAPVSVPLVVASTVVGTVVGHTVGKALDWLLD